jgi:hypothetical protein
VEEPLQLETVSVAEETRGGGKSPEATKPVVHESVAHDAGHTSSVLEAQQARADAYAEDNRRMQTRYACRLGAEVYRTGTSVPNHCCLTDLSSGGCYLEVHLPFPSGAQVEILVRTYEMKLRLRGTVQASHPGYGMGIAFELKTQEEQDNVKKLTDFVVAQSGQ